MREEIAKRWRAARKEAAMLPLLKCDQEELSFPWQINLFAGIRKMLLPVVRLMAPPSRGTRKLSGLSQHKRLPSRKRVPSIYSTVPKTFLAPCFPGLADGQGFRSGASL